MTAGTSATLGGATTSLGVTAALPLPGARGPAVQSILTRSAPVTSRYLTVTFNHGAAQALQVGILAVGLSFQWPYAYGPGRVPIDTSQVTELIDGGFGIDPGVVKGGFRWRFIDLLDGPRDILWDITMDRGIGAPIIIVEDCGVASPPDASVHYGLFEKFEPWERADPRDTQWALSMREWR